MLIWKQAWFCTGELMKQTGKSYQRMMEEGSYDTDIIILSYQINFLVPK